jgi:hypothetical protein
LKVSCLGVDVLELRVAIGVPASLSSLARPLQAVAHLVKQVADLLRTDRMALRVQLGGKLAQALARPAQRRLGVAARHRLDERFEIGHERRIFLGQGLASRAGASDPLLARRLVWRVISHLSQLAHPVPNALAQDPRRRCHRRDSTSAQRERLARCPQPLHPLVHHRREALEPRANFIDARLIDQHG